MLNLDLVKEVNRVIWIQDYDEEGSLNEIRNTFKDYKIHIWNSVCPSMFGITINDDMSTELHRFIYWISQKFTGKDVLVIMDFDAFMNDYRVLRAIKLSKPYLDKKDCYIICLSSRIIHDKEYGNGTLYSIKSVMFILKKRLERIDKDEIKSIISKECDDIGINPENIDIDNNVSYTLSYKPKPVVEMMIRLSLIATGRLDKDFLDNIGEEY